MAENWNFQNKLCVNYNKVKPSKPALFWRPQEKTIEMPTYNFTIIIVSNPQWT